jgi:four helix bundle protein
MARDFHNIKAWKHAHQLTLDVYRATSAFPNEEKFGITSQVRRASASVGANIAEGSARGTVADYLRFLDIARGSLRETDNFLLLAKDLTLLPAARFEMLQNQVNETGRTLTGLIKAIRNNR